MLSTFQDSEPATPAAAAGHPAVTAGQTCGSCKAPAHDYRHDTPYEDQDCARCHGLESWRRVTYVHSDKAFDEGFHVVLGCGFCHTEKVPLPSPDCRTCHEPQHAAIKPCVRCHNANTWRLFNPLPKGHVSVSGGHAELTCFSCHVGKTAFTKPKQCVDCHGTRHGGLTDCGRCHDPARGWTPKPGFNHDRYFKLTGSHKKLACAKCHTKNRFAGIGTNCSSCHGRKHGGLTACATCHTTASFKPSTFRHSSRFVLRGAHAKLACSRCHPKRLYANVIGASTRCSGCHGTRHGGLTACGECHSTTAFKPSIFRHSTKFVLSGAHARLACSKCHPRNVFANVIGSPSACTNCHGTRHGGLKKCENCHTTTAFKPSTFRHSSVYELTGQHSRLACSKCHPSGKYADVIGSPSACTNCHGVKHGNQTDCAKCHTTAGFVPAKRIAHPVSPQLGGEHADRPCTLCHPTLVFNAPVKPCSDCHDAPHAAPDNCLQCHTPTTWPVRHSEIGYHTSLAIVDACQYCHTTEKYPDNTCTWCH